MDLKSAWLATRQWVPFTLRTMAYGTVSLTLGPLTPQRSASLWAMRRWCQASARGLAIEIQASGLENVPPGVFVYCSNHQSLLDILALGAVLPGDFKWAAKRSLMKIPFLGWHLRLAGHVPVDRTVGSRAAVEAISRFEEVLKSGKPLLVFPEGTRSEDGVLRQFKNGGFYAAVRAGVPVVPVAIDGTHLLMKKGAIDAGDGTLRIIRVRVGAPIAVRPDGREGARVNELRERAHAAVSELLRSIGGRVEAPAGAAATSEAPASGVRTEQASG
ncbi:lysophospholipid acyltransferase family protein [Sorangium sp. So ce726]|uniref:lysophospholipid acyltransferase family protein n=1 Tax=Sorangium sp. So ce726 TaxID=3133319 RepID=UPI003F6376E2